MSFVIKPKSEVIDNLELVMAKAFPLQLRREIRQYFKEVNDVSALREQTLDEVEGLIIRISRSKTFELTSQLVEKAALPVQACLWERFQHLLKCVKENPDNPQMVPAAISRYLREGLSSLWHNMHESH